MVLSVWPFVTLKIYFSLTIINFCLKFDFHVLIKKRHCRAVLSCPVTLLRNNPRMQASLFALYLAYSVCTTSANEWTSISTAPPGWCTRHYTVFYKCCLEALTCSCSHCTRHRRGISLQSRINIRQESTRYLSLSCQEWGGYFKWLYLYLTCLRLGQMLRRVFVLTQKRILWS